MIELTTEIFDKFCGTDYFIEISGPGFYRNPWIIIRRKSPPGNTYEAYSIERLPEDYYDAQAILDTINIVEYWNVNSCRDCYWTGELMTQEELIDYCEDFGGIPGTGIPDDDDDDYTGIPDDDDDDFYGRY